MALRLTLDLFSGRPNPSFILDGLEARELIGRLTRSRRRARSAAPRPPAGTLGYRGILIEQVETRTDRRVPRAFRLAAGHIYTGEAAFPATDPFVEEYICGAGGPIRLLPDGPAISGRCLEEIDRFRHLLGRHRRRRQPRPHHGPHRCDCAPLWEPSWWNDAGQVQFNNNCYNYATDYRSDTYAQPGRAAGAMYQQIVCADVRAGAVADKLVAAPNARNRCPREGHLVALVVGPGWDFHWYRKGRDGRWTHKPGGTEATDVDNSGNPITDPRTADRGSYTDFCTFMVVMHGHVKLR
jgi:hypothetical protein